MLPQLGSVALQSGEHVGETIARLVAGKETKPFKYTDKGTMATIGRGAAVVQMLRGKTMKGKKAQLAWGTVHLALLPTNEDRAKAIVDWTGAALTHQRSGRISVETDRRRDATFFEDLGAGGTPRPKRATGTIRIEVPAVPDRGWHPADKGDIAVSQKRAGGLRLAPTRSCRPDLPGRINPTAALLRGAIRSRATRTCWSCFQRLPPAGPRVMSDGLVKILDGNTFVVSDDAATSRRRSTDPTGLFSFDTRFLSKWVLTVDGERLNALSIDDLQYFETRFFLVPGTGHRLHRREALGDPAARGRRTASARS